MGWAMQISWLGAMDVGRLGTALPCSSQTDRWGKGGEQGERTIIIPTLQVGPWRGYLFIYFCLRLQLVEGALGS